MIGNSCKNIGIVLLKLSEVKIESFLISIWCLESS